MAPVIPFHPRYLPKDTTPQSTLNSSILVLRPSDQSTFIASHLPRTLTLDPPPHFPSPSSPTVTTLLAPILISAAGTHISRILNHPNVVSLVDLVQTSQIPGEQVLAPYKRYLEVETPHDFSVWEDMNAGCLSLLLPSPNSLSAFDDGPAWHKLASQDFTRFSLPEGLCWHVLFHTSRALLWLHFGVKETEGVSGEWMAHDDDWQPILIRDISPGQIWFKHPTGDEHYGECKLGGFQWAKVTGCPGGQVAMVERMEGASVEKMYYWAPEIYENTHAWSRPSEIWSLGAVIYTMMTGIPPPRYFEYNWVVSRMADKGFSKGLRDLVGRMLSTDVGKRPETMRLVSEVEEGMRYWRTSTVDGREYVDIKDEYRKRMYLSSQLRKRGIGLNTLEK